MGGRWWEYYAVRYFVGTVVGAIIIFVLNGKGSPLCGVLELSGKATDVSFLGLSLAAPLGFAFCYISSAPVLTLHATRAHLRSSERSPLWKPVLCLLLSTGAVTVTFWALNLLSLFPAAIFGVVVGIQVALLILAITSCFKTIEQFYRDLANARAKAGCEKDKPPTSGTEYITSYRHLREHGNAFAILLCERILAYVIFNAPSSRSVLLVVTVWFIPASAVWLVGTMLESRYVSVPKSQYD